MERLFSFEGRINRSIFVITYFSLWLINYLTFRHTTYLIYLMIGMPLVVLQAMIIVKRLHDINKPSWQYWLTWVPFYNIYMIFLLVFKEGTMNRNEYV